MGRELGWAEGNSERGAKSEGGALARASRGRSEQAAGTRRPRRRLREREACSLRLRRRRRHGVEGRGSTSRRTTCGASRRGIGGLAAGAQVASDSPSARSSGRRGEAVRSSAGSRGRPPRRSASSAPPTDGSDSDGAPPPCWRPRPRRRRFAQQEARGGSVAGACSPKRARLRSAPCETAAAGRPRRAHQVARPPGTAP